eukprot:10389_1
MARSAGKGWDVQLLGDQQIATMFLCESCNSICCDAVELGCNHKDEDICTFCSCCLDDLIKDNDNKCPINGHPDPVIIPNKFIRRYILYKLHVLCPSLWCPWTGSLNELITNHLPHTKMKFDKEDNSIVIISYGDKTLRPIKLQSFHVSCRSDKINGQDMAG